MKNYPVPEDVASELRAIKKRTGRGLAWIVANALRYALAHPELWM